MSYVNDIVERFRQVVPRFSDKFTRNVPVSSASATNGVLTVVTEQPHGISAQQAADGATVNLSTIRESVSINSAVISNGMITYTTSEDHDLTKHPYLVGDTDNIAIEGMTPAAFNGQFDLARVPNRRTFIVATDQTSIPTVLGSVLQPAQRAMQLNYRIDAVVNETTLQLNANGFSDVTYSGDYQLRAEPFIGLSSSTENITDLYTPQPPNRFTAFIQFGDVTVSKTRTASDFTQSATIGSNIRQQLQQQFSVFVIAPTKDQYSSETNLPIFLNEIPVALNRAVYDTGFSTPFSSQEKMKVSTLGYSKTEENNAFEIWQYDYSMLFYNTIGDGYDSGSRAFRDIELVNQQPPFRQGVNLDEDPQ